MPQTEIVELGVDDDVEEVLRKAAGRAEVLAVGGGDGTVSCAAGVAAEAVDLAARSGERGAHLIDRPGEMLLDERRDRAVEHHGKARILDVPTHDPERVREEPLG